MPGWQDEVVRAVAVRVAADSSASSRQTWRCIGEARPEGRAGWFAVDVRGRPVNPDSLDAMRLAAPDAPPGPGAFRVMEAVQDGESLQVRVGAHVDSASLSLWSRAQAPGYLWEKLREGLASMTTTGLADSLARGQLAPVPATLPGAAPTDLNKGQRRAYAACMSPGLHLVWGPPGTGKTAVLAWAINDLLSRGKRVLLVSNANIAVDNAVQGVIALRSPTPGQLVRVGPPQLPAVAEDKRVALPRLVAARCHAVEEQRISVERRLIERRERRDQAASLRAGLQAYDHDAYLAALARVKDEEHIAGLARNAHERQRRTVEVLATRDEASRELGTARRAAEQAAPARRLLSDVAELRERLEALEVDVGRHHVAALQAQEGIRSLEQALPDGQDGGMLARLRGRGHRSRLAEQRAQAGRDLEAAVERKRDAELMLDGQRHLLEPQITAHLQHAAPVDEQELVRIDRLLRTTEVALAYAQTGVAGEERDLETAQQALLAAEAGPRATAEDRRRVAEADEHGWPQQHAQLASLLHELDDEDAAALESRHEQLLEELDRLRRGAETVIVAEARLVATTLARFRIHPATLAGPYDVVLVDEVSTATVPEVLLALSTAREGAVLFGDFLQIGAIQPKGLQQFDDLAKQWWSDDCFSRCDIDTPSDAAAEPGCAVLTDQYRFGPAITTLANDVLYGGVLQVAHQRPRDDGDHELVLIDTDDLDDLGHIRRTGRYKGWWPAGSLLARVLAQHHHHRDETVGVLAPYRLQVEATVEALRDVEPPDQALTTEVGTVHQFQGRQFDVMVFDLLEDGDGAMRTAQAGGDPFERHSARIFGVGVTRGKRRTYLLASGRAVREAAPDTVLAAVQRLLDDGRAGTVSATQFLTPMGAEPAAIASPLQAEMAKAFASHVRVRAIHDEHTFYDALHGLIEEARSSIWMWAPWTATRTDSVLPLLSAAVDRGVRVTVFVRSDRDSLQGRPRFQERLQNLREAGLHVISYHEMHQKIVVVDEWTSLVGSLNALSHRTTREIMIEHEGAFFARRLLDDEHAEIFAAVPPCGRCGSAEVELSRSLSAKRAYTWYWRCAQPSCSWRHDLTIASPPARATADGRRTG